MVVFVFVFLKLVVGYDQLDLVHLFLYVLQRGDNVYDVVLLGHRLETPFKFQLLFGQLVLRYEHGLLLRREVSECGVITFSLWFTPRFVSFK